MCCRTASSISSPATLTDVQKMTPASEITATSVVPPPMSTIRFPPGSWIGRPARLLDQTHLTGSGVPGRVAHRAPLDLRDPGGYPDHHPRLEDRAEPPLRPGDEVAQHSLGHLEVRDDPVLQRLDHADLGRCAPDHRLGFVAHGQDRAVVLADRDD